MEREEYAGLDDFALMALVSRQGDRTAFDVLVRRYQTILLNFFLRSGVEYDAEDLVQLTFLRLYRYRENYRPSAKFTTFLFMIAHQVWIDELRKRKRSQQLTDALTEVPDPVLPADPVQPGREVEMRMDLARALATLPDGLRRVVELGVYQDLPYAEIAEILSIPVGTVKSRMFNALARLRTCLTADKGGTP
ncbi:MAG: RNA polymerase sigma factor [Kiritimatiellae bacterium]|nr:RNA polymerase sigma factor [Kiritimatiellia bacterium]